MSLLFWEWEAAFYPDKEQYLYINKYAKLFQGISNDGFNYVETYMPCMKITSVHQKQQSLKNKFVWAKKPQTLCLAQFTVHWKATK